MSNVNPLDNKVVNGGFCGIIRTLGCIGDSLSSGEMESRKDEKNSYHDYFEYSWGQFLARAAGLTVYNFSRGGMSAKGFLNAEGWLDFRNPEKKCQAYVIALGVNDTERGVPIMGDVATDVNPTDCEQNADTFAGDMGRIMSHIKEIEPKARIFLMTIPRHDRVCEAESKKELHAKIIYDLAEKFEFTYVIDMHKHMPVVDAQISKVYRMGGHMNAMGYKLMSEYVMSYMDYIIRENYEDFKQIAFVGRENDLHNEKYVW